MGLFSTPPRRITQRDLEGKRGFLSSEPGLYGEMERGNDRLRPDEVKVFKAIIEGSLDSERKGGKDWSGISKEELPEIRKQLEDSGHFDQSQIEKAINHMEKKL